LVEPLCGGLAVSLGLAPERALINDLNPHTINFYSWLKRGLRIPLEMQNDRLASTNNEAASTNSSAKIRQTLRKRPAFFTISIAPATTVYADSTARENSTFLSAAIRN